MHKLHLAIYHKYFQHHKNCSKHFKWLYYFNLLIFQFSLANIFLTVLLDIYVIPNL